LEVYVTYAEEVGDMSGEEVLERLRKNMEMIRRFGVRRIGIFGSAVRGKLEEGSDIDIVVEFERGKATFRNVCGLIDFLEELLGREVDLLTPDGIESIRIKHVREEIRETVKYA